MEPSGSPSPADQRLVALIERAARYQERTVACLRAGRRPDGSIQRWALERAISELSAAIDCLRQASEISESSGREPLQATLHQREEERRTIEALLRRQR